MLRFISVMLMLLSALTCLGQAQVLRLSGEEQHHINRLELLDAAFDSTTVLTHTGLGAYELAQSVQRIARKENLSNIDAFNNNYIAYQLEDVLDAPLPKEESKRWFYRGAHMFSLYPRKAEESLNYSIVINPIINYQHAFEANDSSGTKFLNTRGFDIRANIKRRIYLYTSLTENQERGPSYVQDYTNNMFQVPGATYIKMFNKAGYKGGFDYSIARGHIGYNVLPKHLDISFGHDKFFIGNGYRSIFLSDFGANMLFAKMNLKFWKLHYQTLLFELMPTQSYVGDLNKARKYAAMHHASFHFTPRFQLGVFEGVIHARKNHFELQYLNPLIFYRTIEQSLGSPDNAVVGLDTRIIPLKRVELYGQFLLDEFVFDSMRTRSKDWRNKYAVQAGIKHVNLAGVDNLDVQLEYNYIRPFVYSYHDSVSDYSHYNQPLAHPNGANLIEWVGIVRYQPSKRLMLSTTAIRRLQGLDTAANFSNGGNIFKSYNWRPSNIGFTMGNGMKQVTQYFNFNASYNIYFMCFLDYGVTINNITSNNTNRRSIYSYIGLRLNTARRRYDY